MAVILVDFDGTCIPSLPEIGHTEIETGAEAVLKELVAKGHSIVLWTARNSSRNNPWNYIEGKFRNETSLEEAVRWFKERDIPLSGINEVPDEEKFIGYSRKTLGDYLIDDTAIGCPLTYAEVSYYSYVTKEYKVAKSWCVNWNEIRGHLVRLGVL